MEVVNTAIISSTFLACFILTARMFKQNIVSKLHLRQFRKDQIEFQNQLKQEIAESQKVILADNRLLKERVQVVAFKTGVN